ncbi:hypothetical protein OG21DRAFT_1371241, partial [Imleria badia]
RKLTQSLLQFLLGTIEKSPDVYLDELQEMLATSCDVYVSRATVWRMLRKADFTMKKLLRVAIECSAQAWFEYLAKIGTYRTDQLVFVDESSVDCQTTYHGHGW